MIASFYRFNPTRIIKFAALLSFLFLAFVSANRDLSCAEPPLIEEVKARISQEHPRLFINKTTLPAFKEHIRTNCTENLDRLKKKISQYPKTVELEYKTDIVEIQNGRMIFKRQMGDQNAVLYGVKRAGGQEALECAIVYLATDDDAYRVRAIEYMGLCVEFIQLARRSEILPEWYHTERLSALIAYDWLFDKMTEQERRAFIVPMLEYIDYMRSPGYQRNNGGAETGNYGENGLWWFAGLAAWKDGYCDRLAEEMLERGYKLDTNMMETRERISGGKGVLTSICSGYSFGAYPWASYNFLYTLKSAVGIDGTELWTQMRDYANYFSWMAIPDQTSPTFFRDFGWGDASHDSNVMNADLMYTHLAQAVNLYGKTAPQKTVDQIYSVMRTLPRALRKIQGTNSYPYVPFILFNFDPGKVCPDTEKISADSNKTASGSDKQTVKTAADPVGGPVAEFFPSFGLMNVRSGITDSDTFASFKAGAKHAQHQHYDENTFIIYKKGFLACDTGTRGQAEQHLIYYPQTVAHNGILIRMKEEPLSRYWYPANAPRIKQLPFADGGQNMQRVCKNLGFSSSPYHAVSAGDASACYSSAKCSQAVRIFVYVKPDYFVVYDQVTSKRPDQQKVFLLHSQNEPVYENGVWRSGSERSTLFVKTLFPAKVQSKKIGGPGHEFETGGRNYPLFASADKKLWTRPNSFGRYRIEISPEKDDLKARFLHLLEAADGSPKKMISAKTVQTGKQDGVEFIDRKNRIVTVMFNREGKPGGEIKIVDQGRIVLREDLLH